MKLQARAWTVTAAVLAALGLLTSWVWDRLPDQLPVHYGIDFQPDGYAPRSVGLLLLPGIVLGLSCLLSVLAVIEPRREHIRSSEKAIQRIWIGLVVCFGIMHAGILLTAAGVIEGHWTVPFSLGLMLAVVGNFLGKVRSNFFIGIRTPWTLSSELSWERTHRLGGRLFVLLGIALMAVAPLGPGRYGSILFAALMAVVLWTAIYSFVVWRKDPARVRRTAA